VVACYNAVGFSTGISGLFQVECGENMSIYEYLTEALGLIVLMAFLLAELFNQEKANSMIAPLLKNRKLKIVVAIFMSLFFYPVVALIAQFFDMQSMAATAWEFAPNRSYFAAVKQRTIFDADTQTELRKRFREIKVGDLRIRLQNGHLGRELPAERIISGSYANADAKLWAADLNAALARLIKLLPGSPPLPVIEVHELYDSHGYFNNLFALAINSDSDEPLRTIVHELTHLYLLWAMIPGLPVDCPRWLNEGLAEHLSGEAMRDEHDWEKYAMVRQRTLVDLDEVSPAFSWPGYAVEWHARDAVAMFLDRHDEATLHRLINGLRLARPFHSVYAIVTGQPFESFSADWKEEFSRRRVLENQSKADVLARLTWLAENRGFVEVQILLWSLPVRWLSREEQTALLDRARKFEADRCDARGDYLEAMGWMRRSSPKVHWKDALWKKVASSWNSLAAVEPSSGNIWKPKPEKPPFNEVEQFFAWLLSILVCGLIVAGYSAVRARLAVKLQHYWLSPVAGTTCRWLVVGITGLAGGWFLRFLVVSMIPYAGLAALSDLHRIMLGEVLVVILWLALAWQLDRWNSQSGEVQTRLTTVEPQSGAGVHLLTFLVIGIVPPLLASYQGGWRVMGIEAAQVWFAAILFMASTAAFGLVVWQAAILWKAGPGSNVGPVLVYALFRGGLAADPYGSLFALVAGWQLVRLARRTQSPAVAILGDLLLCGPAMLLCTGWFPACDPIGGYWYGGGSAIIWWLPAAIALFLLRDSGRGCCRQG